MDLNHRGPVGRRIYSPVQSTAMRYLQIFGGGYRIRTDLCPACKTGVHPEQTHPPDFLATRDGFEPPTFGFGDQRSARLNYRAI